MSIILEVCCKALSRVMIEISYLLPSRMKGVTVMQARKATELWLMGYGCNAYGRTICLHSS
jgi:hypothetical protein